MKKLFLMLCFIFTLALSGCKSIVIQSTSPIFALDTVIEVIFYNEDNYMEHYKEIKKIYQSVDRVAGDFRSNPNKNSVYDLNQKRAIEADPLLADMVRSSVELMEETKGYFNPFIGRLSHIWKDAINTKNLPTPELIKNELEIMNNTSIIIEGNSLTLIGDGNLDLGGMAKGYATEMVRDYLVENNVKGYLVNAGRSNIICGEKAGNSFKIGITDPLTGLVVDYVEGVNLSIATSSHEMQQAVIDDKLYHHLISPFIGYPVNNMDSISISSSSPLRGDVYSTALFLMDIDEIKKLDINVIILKGKRVEYNSINGKE